MSQPQRKDLSHVEGDSLNGLVFVWKNSSGVAKDLTGYTARLTIKNSSGTQLLQLTNGSGLVLTGSEGKVEVEATPVQMAGAVEGEHVWDLELTSSDLTIKRTIVGGRFVVSDGVTD